jgi:hypothetical protein
MFLKDYFTNAMMSYNIRAENTRFNVSIQRSALQISATLPGIQYRQCLGVPGDVFELTALLIRFTDNYAVSHNHAPYRTFAFTGSERSKLITALHKVLVVIHASKITRFLEFPHILLFRSTGFSVRP